MLRHLLNVCLARLLGLLHPFLHTKKDRFMTVRKSQQYGPNVLGFLDVKNILRKTYPRAVSLDNGAVWRWESLGECSTFFG